MVAADGRSTWSLEISVPSRLWQVMWGRLNSLNVQGGRRYARIFGVVAGVCATCIVALAVWVGFKVLVLTSDPARRAEGILLAFGVLSIPAIFFTVVCYRLLLDRPAANGTLFSGLVWVLVGAVLALCDGFAVYSANLQLLDDWRGALSVVGVMVLAAASFRLAYISRSGNRR